MTGKSNTSGAKRYDDMIGILVAFEKRAKTMEVCCDVQAAAVPSQGSNSSSTTSSYIRHADTIKRSHRGRIRDTVPRRSKDVKTNKNTENVTTVYEEIHCYSSANNNPHRTNKETDHTIILVSDDVEVVMNFNESEAQVNLDASHVNDTAFKLSTDKRVKPENDFSTSFEHLEVKAVSSSSSTIIPVAIPQALKLRNGETNESHLNDDLNNNANSRKKCESSIPRPSSILRDRQVFLECSEKEIFRETKTNQKVAAVAFRDPVCEVIHLEHDLLAPCCTVFNIGDQVEIADGIHRRRIGRIVKTLGDIVQLEMGNVKPMYLYLSPDMLQPVQGHHILA